MDQSAVLAGLGLGVTNSGAYGGRWLDAGGETIDVINPATGEAIAQDSKQP